MNNMFDGCNKLKEIKGINNFNTIKVNNMYCMFSACKELKSLDLSNFNTSNVTNMEYMFDECIKLKEIKGINKLNTINVISMNSMFQNCKELEYLDLSSFNTSNVTNMGRMFKNCYKLKQIKGINNFNISKVTNKDEIFEGCNELEFLILSKFNIHNDINNNYNEKIKIELNKEKNKNLQLMNIINLQKKKMNETANNEKVIAVNFRTLIKVLIILLLVNILIVFQMSKKNCIKSILN